MTDKLKVDLLLEKHGLPSSLERNIDTLPTFYAPADDTERRQMQRGKPYIDLDGEWRTGREYVHTDLLNPHPNVSQVTSEDMRNLRRGAAYGVIGGLILYGLAYLFWEYAWPFVWAWMVRP